MIGRPAGDAGEEKVFASVLEGYGRGNAEEKVIQTFGTDGVAGGVAVAEVARSLHG